MPRVEPPCASLSLPNVGEAPLGGLTRTESSAGSIAQGHQGLEPHDEREVTIHSNELNLSLEGREVDYPAAYECIEYRALTDRDPVIRRIHD